MKKHILVFLALLIPLLFYAQHQNVIGKWKTIDDETGEPLSVIEIFENKGKIYGKVVKIYDLKNHRTCENCSGDDKDKPILGLTVIKGLSQDGDVYSGGKILDPKHGRLYKCYITNLGIDKLKVRGYIGFSLIGRTQYWHRVK